MLKQAFCRSSIGVAIVSGSSEKSNNGSKGLHLDDTTLLQNVNYPMAVGEVAESCCNRNDYVAQVT